VTSRVGPSPVKGSDGSCPDAGIGERSEPTGGSDARPTLLAARTAPSHWRTRPVPTEERVRSRLHDDILIEAPVETVVAVFCDTERLSSIKSMGGMKHEMSNFSGPMDQVGTTFDVNWRIAGIDGKVTNTIIEVEPNRLIRIRGGDGDITAYRFEPEGSGTRVSLDGEAEMSRIYKLLDKVVLRNAMEKGTREFLEKMKGWAEAKVPVTA
jgi:carbon monoxide dehydrogenase subunit G